MVEAERGLEVVPEKSAVVEPMTQSLEVGDAVSTSKGTSLKENTAGTVSGWIAVGRVDRDMIGCGGVGERKKSSGGEGM